MQEGDGGSHGPVPGPFVDQPDAGAGDRSQRLADVGDAVTNVVQSLAPAGDELPDGRVRTQRLEQLNVAHAQRADPGRTVTDRQHGLPDSLLLVLLQADYPEAERLPVHVDGQAQVTA